MPASSQVPAMPARFSYSAAAMFNRCARAWRFRYVDRLPDPPGAAAVIGSFVHSVLERFFELGPGNRTADAMRSIAGETWRAEMVEEALAELGSRDTAASKQQAWRLLSGLWFVEDPASVLVEATEERIETDLAGVPFVAVIDRVERKSDGSVLAADYKTGRLPRERFPNPHVDQVQLYAAAIEAAGREVNAVSIVYLRGRLVQVTSNPASRERAVESLASTWEDLRMSVREDAFGASPSALCGWCSFIGHCEDGRAELVARVRRGRIAAGAPGLDVLGLQVV